MEVKYAELLLVRFTSSHSNRPSVRRLVPGQKSEIENGLPFRGQLDSASTAQEVIERDLLQPRETILPRV